VYVPAGENIEIRPECFEYVHNIGDQYREFSLGKIINRSLTVYIGMELKQLRRVRK
jgi:hypothetical protein